MRGSSGRIQVQPSNSNRCKDDPNRVPPHTLPLRPFLPMALVLRRALVQTLIPVAPLLFTRLPSLGGLRRRSGSSSSEEGAELQLVEIDLGEAAVGEESLAAGARLLEDAIHKVMVRKSAPAWLPFLPGASYWVPPRRKMHSEPRMADLIGRIANPLTEEELLSLRSVRGWPSSAYFIEGLPHPILGDLEKNAAKLEEDET